MGQYLQRAEYIKKTVLDVPDTPAGGGAAQAQKPKDAPEGEDNKEEEKILKANYSPFFVQCLDIGEAWKEAGVDQGQASSFQANYSVVFQDY